jgi:hypothetical protein
MPGKAHGHDAHEGSHGPRRNPRSSLAGPTAMSSPFHIQGHAVGFAESFALEADAPQNQSAPATLTSATISNIDKRTSANSLVSVGSTLSSQTCTDPARLASAAQKEDLTMSVDASPDHSPRFVSACMNFAPHAGFVPRRARACVCVCVCVHACMHVCMCGRDDEPFSWRGLLFSHTDQRERHVRRP